jgi:hypothetical protein
MVTRYKTYKLVFDYAKFQNDLIAFHDAHVLNWSEIDQLAGQTIGLACKLKQKNGNKNHKLSTWLAYVNLMDIDPRDYFVFESIT